MIEDLIDHGFVIGVFNQYIADQAKTNRIVVRLDYQCVSGMVDYIAALGHRDIMFIGGDMLRQCGVDVFQIYREAMARNRLSVQEEYLLGAEALTKTHGIATFAQFMERKLPLPTCILCGNDIMAFGVIEVLRNSGIRVPEDVSVVGSDDILVSRYFDPPLTTLRYDFDEMMKTLTFKVIECMENPFNTPFIKVYPGTLVERKSCLSLSSQRDVSQGVLNAVSGERL
jgi:LacI family transcriptional regulator